MNVEILPSITATGQRTERCATPDGEIHIGPGCIYRAARHLIATGVSSKTKMYVIRDGKVCLTGRISAFAVRTWGGNGRDPYSRAWSPMPGEPLPPTLARWWRRVQGAAPVAGGRS